MWHTRCCTVGSGTAMFAHWSSNNTWAQIHAYAMQASTTGHASLVAVGGRGRNCKRSNRFEEFGWQCHILPRRSMHACLGEWFVCTEIEHMPLVLGIVQTQRHCLTALLSAGPCGCCFQRGVGCRHGLCRLRWSRSPAVRVQQPALRLHLLWLRRVRRPGFRPRFLGQRKCHAPNSLVF